MTTLDRVRAAALERFAAAGYTATSLSAIASDCGLRKPSLYTYYSGKREMFLDLARQTAGEELAFTARRLALDLPVAVVLEDHLAAVTERFGETASLRFWVRTLLTPPRDLSAEIGRYEKTYRRGTETAIAAALKREPVCPEAKRFLLTRAYLGILQGLYAEMLCGGGKKTDSAVPALWSVFRCAMTL